MSLREDIMQTIKDNSQTEWTDQHLDGVNAEMLADQLEKQVTDIIQGSYVEGFTDGKDNGNLPYKYPMLSIAFLMSNARALITEPSEVEQEFIDKWNDAKFCDREDDTKWPEFHDIKFV